MGNTRNRGFASMDPDMQRKIASKGGRAAHARGTAHQFTSDEAREAGRKGGVAVSRNREHMSAIGRQGGHSRGRNREHLEARGESPAETRHETPPESRVIDHETAHLGSDSRPLDRMERAADRHARGLDPDQRNPNRVEAGDDGRSSWTSEQRR